jgi:hypothetical protein
LSTMGFLKDWYFRYTAVVDDRIYRWAIGNGARPE